MSRDGYTGFSRGEARTRTATSLSFETMGPLRKLAKLPWGFILLIVAMALTGAAMLYSSAHTNPGESDLWFLQLSRFGLTFVMMLVMALFPLSLWRTLALPAYAFTVLLLVLVEVVGVTGGGAQRWLQVGPVAVQPSEFAKLAVTLALAWYYDRVITPRSGRFVIHLGALVIILIPAVLIFKQPDFGTTLALIASGGVVIFLAGMSMRVILGGVVAGIAAIPAIYFSLAAYQRERVDTFLSQLSGDATNALGESYQIEQAKIAIGSGGWNGKGYLAGIQSQQDYVPEQHTDFILTVIAEEFGFLGTTALLLGFAVILGWAFYSASQSRSWFGRLAGAGATATVAFYIVFNVGMVIGLLPVVGMPLPLISYGGTALLTTMACFGLILSAHMHRDDKLSSTGLI
ncbi:rod shape-determining protein RodA [Hyphomonas johnsonii]|uniref:Cell wall polymerase n=1 Tax=Hyphomonas johnsonii MHS-2 TaxID=1280950 RepID=A0A059FQV3_9PROT|nr:rod shape-determining protein RodA [Hyphomonas johnsonii]KCZ92858.1 rod shape-determining protein RodA [Hyphomonas johnsonii MHS-2]